MVPPVRPSPRRHRLRLPGARDGYTFDAKEADSRVKWIETYCTHIEGQLAGKPFLLEPWQKAIVGALFGWKNADGWRRYRTLFLYVPRKNGKTPFAAAICLCVLFADGEAGAQIYGAAAESDQAALLYRQAQFMVQNSKVLSKYARVYSGQSMRSIVLLDREGRDSGSAYRVVTSKAESKHGGNTHLFLIDELHAINNADLIDVAETSMASANRKQPLIIYLTTADFERPSVCNEKHDYARLVRDNGGDRMKPGNDATFLPVVYEASIDDDWRAVETWRKANPNLGVSVSEEYLDRKCKEAEDAPRLQNIFKRLHLNIRTAQDVVWIPTENWDRCRATYDGDSLLGEPCFGGLDLAPKHDLSAFVLVFPPCGEREKYAVLAWFWRPADTLRDAEDNDNVPYATWAQAGYLRTTPGDTTNFEAIESDLKDICERYGPSEVAFDPWNARQMADQLGAWGLSMVEFPQTSKNFNEPCKTLENLVGSGGIMHDGHPILRWNVGNTEVKENPDRTVRPIKPERNSKRKIDGTVAMLMGLARAIFGDEGGSIWESDIDASELVL